MPCSARVSKRVLVSGKDVSCVRLLQVSAVFVTVECQSLGWSWHASFFECLNSLEEYTKSLLQGGECRSYD